MWVYQQSTGVLTHGGEYVATGYSGRGDGLNNPAEEAVADTGPLPHGDYTIGPLIDHPTCGPLAMRLYPIEGTDMQGRAGFLIHGDTAAANHTASHGCIILGRAVRVSINNSGDAYLRVIP